MECSKLPVNSFEFEYLVSNDELKEFAHVNEISIFEMILNNVKYE